MAADTHEYFCKSFEAQMIRFRRENSSNPYNELREGDSGFDPSIDDIRFGCHSTLVIVMQHCRLNPTADCLLGNRSG